MTPAQQEKQSQHKKVYIANLDSKVSIEDIYELFGLKSTAYLRKNCHVDFPLNQQIQRTRGHVYITVPKYVCDELAKLIGVEFKGKCLFIEDGNVRPKVTNPNTTGFASPNLFEPLTFMNSSLALGNKIDISEERDFHVNFKRAVRNSQQNFKYIFKQRSQVVVNTRPEN